MHKNNKQAFTFVELIVVITIMAFLATIGFVAYKGYIASSYDSNRLVQLSDIHDGLELMSISSKLPFPENMVELTASGTTYGYQGDTGESIIQAIGYDGGGKDPEYDIPFVYMLGKNGRDFQLMAFIRDAAMLSYSAPVYADNINYSEFFPKTTGKPLGILVDANSQEPLHMSGSLTSSYDIVSGSANLKAYLTTKDIVYSESQSLTQLLPTVSCQRILDLGKSEGNGEYILEFAGGKKEKVYCDMEIDGGGWTLVARSVLGNDTLDFGWEISHGSPINNSIPYSMGESVADLSFNEILYTTYTDAKQISSASKFIIDYTFVKDNISPASTLIGNISNCQTLAVDVQDICGRSTEISQPVQYWGIFNKSNMYYLYHINQDSNTGLSASSYVGANIFGEDFQNEPGMIFVR